MSHSRVKHASLADLESVHLVTEEAEDVDEEHFLLTEEDFSEAEALLIEEGLNSFSLEEQDLVDRAKKISESSSLEEIDRKELLNELMSAQAGDKEALKRLSNLIYYLE